MVSANTHAEHFGAEHFENIVLQKYGKDRDKNEREEGSRLRVFLQQSQRRG